MMRAAQQNMDFKWQIARKIDRIDLGSLNILDFYWRNSILYGLVRAIDPEETKPDDQKVVGRSIAELITSLDERIKDLNEHDTTALQLGKMNLEEVKEFQAKTMSCWYEVAEVIYRCKLTDNVRYMEAEAP